MTREFKINLAEATIDQAELNALSDWIKTAPQITKGPLTVEFEKQFADYIGCQYAVFVNSGSSANLIMYYALQESGRLRNHKVVVPAVSWITTLSPAIQFGFEPLLCDADPDDLGLDVEHLRRLCREHRPALMILVHVLGHINKMEEIYKICEEYDVLLLEDACEALGSRYTDGRMTGNLGLAGSFSFYYGHHISTIEGGMVCTNDRDLYNLFLSIRSHGWCRDIEEDYKTRWRSAYDVDEFRNYYTFYYPGFNLRSADLNAFLGISQVKKMPEIVRVRYENYQLYARHIDPSFWRQTSAFNELSSFAYGTFVDNRMETFRALKAAGIESRPLICGSMGRQPFWIRKYGELPLPVADRVHYNGIYLPNHANLNEEKIKYIAGVFNAVAKPYHPGN
ncbi:MAG TPA: DegT/DnrJ/EryC1/StrS aminotransferase family protein [Kiritimatiellia bacterium]|nr:DegT/DnrJ/EryC1/StrS aminotransferase family protein [Kiritimatiellia bacterium]HMO98692.1 DegT/DnrJ/EryC1/StrS aminotransferase family protein [Kiritimatiellia bacterium]